MFSRRSGLASLTRRQFLGAGLAAGVAAGAGAGAWLLRQKERFPSRIHGANASLGHLLRETRDFSSAIDSGRIGTLIIGGGVAGLGAAWALERRGVESVVLFELEGECGGNARGGSNSISRYPWGAHYVPLPPESAREVRELFSDLGFLTRGTQMRRPLYDETSLCADPQERLLFRGEWQEGLVPARGLSVEERKEMDAFFALVSRLKQARGRDGRKAFDIPIERSSRDSRFTEFDQISMAEFMKREGFSTAPLRWYVDYCTRDDYGALASQVSAWAALHYFAARTGEAENAEENWLLTWPDGNFEIIRRMRAKLRAQVHTSKVVLHIDAERGGVTYWNVASKRLERVWAERVICATPRFVAQKMIPELQSERLGLEYSPWSVANVSLRKAPVGPGAALAWDNVRFGSDSLGYVVATHQQRLRYPRTETVITHYWPHTEHSPVETRKALLTSSPEALSLKVLEDLERTHPAITSQVLAMDHWVWAHAMLRPRPGWIWGEERTSLSRPIGRVSFAHSDLGGSPIFEEAFTRGVWAANALKVR